MRKNRLVRTKNANDNEINENLDKIKEKLNKARSYASKID